MIHIFISSQQFFELDNILIYPPLIKSFSFQVVLVDMAEDDKKLSILTMPIVKEDFYSFLLKCIQPELSHIKITLVEGKIYEASKNKDKNIVENDSSGSMTLIPVNDRKGKSRFNKGKFSTKRKGF